MELTNMDKKIIKNYDKYIQQKNQIPNETSLAREMGLEHSQIRYRMKLLDEAEVFVSATRENRVLLPGPNYLNAWRGCYLVAKRKLWPQRTSCLIALALYGTLTIPVETGEKPFTKGKKARERVVARLKFHMDGDLF